MNPRNGHSEESVPIEERKWNDIPAYRNFKGNAFESVVSKLVMKLVRHYDQGEREADGAVHWKSMGLKLRHAFHREGGHTFSDSDWLQHICKGSNKTRFQYCKNSADVPLCTRAIGHPGGNVIAPELMGHVSMPSRRKEFLFHRGCSFDVTSILRSGLYRWRKRK